MAHGNVICSALESIDRRENAKEISAVEGRRVAEETPIQSLFQEVGIFSVVCNGIGPFVQSRLALGQG